MPQKPDEPPKAAETPWRRFEHLTRKIVRVPKEAIRDPKGKDAQPRS